jgi:protein-L-isoaspartate(D-aspartate) O-methyltransferase
MAPSAPALHSALVDHLLAIGALTQPPVEAAFRAVPRHLFLPGLPVEAVYRDDAIPTKMADGRAISSSSQPAIMAIMLEQLAVQPGQRVLEIGAGTGYNAALLSQLVGPNGRVVTIDIDDDIVTAARAHLAAAGIENVRVVQADGGEGYAPEGPYDRIILTVGAWDIAPAWYEQLLAGGRLVLPLRVANIPQESVAFSRAPAGIEPRFISQAVAECGFMVLRGAFAGPDIFTTLGPGLTLATLGPAPAPAEQMVQWLMAPATRRGTGLLVTEAEIFKSLALWLDLHTTKLAGLNIEAVPAPASGWPCLFQGGGSPPQCFTYLLLTPDGMAVLDGRDRSNLEPGINPGELGPFELKVMGYGDENSQALPALLDLLAAWDKAARPSGAQARVRVYRPDYPYVPARGETIVSKRWTKLVVDWPAEPIANV